MNNNIHSEIMSKIKQICSSNDHYLIVDHNCNLYAWDLNGIVF